LAPAAWLLRTGWQQPRRSATPLGRMGREGRRCPITVETYRWALSSILQATAAMSAIVAVFLVFLLGDRVKRRNDFWVDFVTGFANLRYQIGQRSFPDVASKIIERLKARDDVIGSYLTGDGTDQFEVVVGIRWDRYAIAREAASLIDAVCLENGLKPEQREGGLEKIEITRQRADDFERALTSMKREIILPGGLSAATMVLAAILLVVSDLLRAEPCGEMRTAAALLVWVTVLCMVAAIAMTILKIRSLLTRWDR
jgi:hypothetical protein